MTYPVYIGDRAAGTMTVTAAGQDTVFEHTGRRIGKILADFC